MYCFCNCRVFPAKHKQMVFASNSLFELRFVAKYMYFLTYIKYKNKYLNCNK